MLKTLFLILATMSYATEPSVKVEGQRVTALTQSITVVFDGPALVSIRDLGTSTEFIHAAPPPNPLDVYFLNGETVGQDKHQKITVLQVSPLAARVTIVGEDSKRSLLITVDQDTGDVLVTPDGAAQRRGVRSVGLKVPVHGEAELILPVLNGLRVKTGNPQPVDNRFPWPVNWDAQLVIAQRDQASMMIHCEDRTEQYKALQLHRKNDHHELVFETESPGPWWDNRTAGGITWRISTYRGGWKIPASRYRNWMERFYDLVAKTRQRPAWVNRVSLAVSWAGPNEAMLDALAAVRPPDETIIHLSQWRTDKYDVNYPEYTATEQATKYIIKANAMGFHVLPHFNYFSVYLKHPLFSELSDFQLRSPDKNQPQGWYWPPETHDYTRMAYIHPGLGLWRNTLVDIVLAACAKAQAPGAFLDQTLCTWNADNAMVQGRNTIGGMLLLEEQFNSVAPSLVLGGEGLNEMSMQRQCFAQAHIYDGWTGLQSWHPNLYVPINAFLWRGHCQLFGYYHLTPETPTFESGVSVYERMGALPTIITGNTDHIRNMSPATRRIFDRAKRWRQVATTMTQPD